MKEHRFAFLLEHRNYRLAGHGCNQPPGTPSTSGLRGSAEANFRASQDAWSRVLLFLNLAMQLRLAADNISSNGSIAVLSTGSSGG